MEEEIEIDFGRLFSRMWAKKKIIIPIILVCTIIAAIVSLMLPKEYTSTATVQTQSAGKVDISGAAAAMAMLGMGGGGASSPTLNYIELMKSRTVLDPIIQEVYSDKDEDKRPNNVDFAKSNLKIENIKGTNLISIESTGRTPEEAQQITDSIVNNFLNLMTTMNQQTQSYMVKFLNERIDNAKKEADEAAQAMETFSKQNKVYSPKEQTDGLLKAYQAYDKTLGEIKVQQQASSASYDSVSAQLGEQTQGAMNYNISDNENVLKIRNEIIAKELQLVGLRQKYQDAHPSIKDAQKELEQLNNSLRSEVAATVVSGAVTLNPTHSALQTARYQAATSMAVANASEAAVRELMGKNEGELAQLSEATLQYVKLQRDSTIKNEVYLNLVKQVEQAKINQTMESMDIQVVDPADLPRIDKPSGPKKKQITAIGFVIGVLISLGYGVVLYRREE